MGFLFMHNFVSPCFGHLENIGSLSYADLVKMLTYFIIQCQILHLLISPPILSDKTSLIFAWKLKFCHWQQILTVVFLEVTVSHCSFLKKCLPNIQVWIISLSGSCFFKLKWCFMKKKSGRGQVIQLATQLHKCLSVFSWENSCTLLCRNIYR